MFTDLTHQPSNRKLPNVDQSSCFELPGMRSMTDLILKMRNASDLDLLWGYLVLWYPYGTLK